MCVSILQIFQEVRCLGGICSCRSQLYPCSKFKILFSSSIPTQAPRTSQASLVKGRAQANAAAQQALIAHRQSIVKCIENYLKIMRANHVSGASKYNEMGSLFLLFTRLTLFNIVTIQVPPFLICKLFAQIFSFINVQLFNR